MAELTKDDIIITITDALRREASGKNDFTVYYGAIESNNDLPEGCVAAHIEEAANDAGVEIVRKGSDRATLRKRGPQPLVA